MNWVNTLVCAAISLEVKNQVEGCELKVESSHGKRNNYQLSII